MSDKYEIHSRSAPMLHIGDAWVKIDDLQALQAWKSPAHEEVCVRALVGGHWVLGTYTLDDVIQTLTKWAQGAG